MFEYKSIMKIMAFIEKMSIAVVVLGTMIIVSNWLINFL